MAVPSPALTPGTYTTTTHRHLSCKCVHPCLGAVDDVQGFAPKVFPLRCTCWSLQPSSATAEAREVALRDQGRRERRRRGGHPVGRGFRDGKVLAPALSVCSEYRSPLFPFQDGGPELFADRQVEQTEGVTLHPMRKTGSDLLGARTPPRHQDVGLWS